MRSLRLAALATLVLLASCGSRDDAEPGAIGADEARELNDAAAMLDANAVDANALRPVAR